MTFAPEWSKPGDELEFGKEPVLAPGVRGTAFDTPNGIYIPLVHAEKRGNGDVGRFLDSLPRDRRVCFPTVISSRLVGMLKRRGFTLSIEKDDLGQVVMMYQRCPCSLVASRRPTDLELHIAAEAKTKR